jgi:hypothetical protein
VSLRTFFANVTGHSPEATLERAEKDFAEGRRSDSAGGFEASPRSDPQPSNWMG